MTKPYPSVPTGAERFTILDALADPLLFGALPAFRSDTWRPWLAFLRAVYGLPMDAADLALFQQHTGRQEPRAGGYPEAVCIVGCQSGKSQVAALVGVYEAAQAVLSGQSGVFVPLVAQDLRGAQRALLSYVREAVDASPILKREVVRSTATELEIAGRVVLGVYPCRPASVRGIRAACVVVDELAFFISTEGNPTDKEMLRAIRSRVAMTGGKILVLSSPYAQTGALWDLHRKHYGREESPTLVWTASAFAMNSTLPQDYLLRMEEDDPEAYRSEVLGEFRAGISTFLDPDALQACVAVGVRQRAPWARGDKPLWLRGRLIQGAPPEEYVAFVDAASGSGKDAFTVGIAHRDGERAVLDVVQAWRPPFNPSGVIAEACALLKTFGLRQATGDRYAPGFVNEGFRAGGVSYLASEKDRSALYLELLPLVNAERAVLLDDPELLKEFRGLERKRGTSGRDRVDHRPGAHDDRSNAAAGALVLAADSKRHYVGVRENVWG